MTDEIEAWPEAFMIWAGRGSQGLRIASLERTLGTHPRLDDVERSAHSGRDRALHRKSNQRVLSAPATATERTAIKELAKYSPIPSPIRPVLRIKPLKVSYLRSGDEISEEHANSMPRPQHARCELRGVHEDGAGAVGADAAEERWGTLLADDPKDAVKAGRVAER